MSNILKKIKSVFSKKKSSESLAMWNKLSKVNTCTADIPYMSKRFTLKRHLGLSEAEINDYLTDLYHRHQKVHNQKL